MKRAGFVCDICGAEVESDAWNASGVIDMDFQIPEQESEAESYRTIEMTGVEICLSCAHALESAINTVFESRRNAH